MFYTLLLLPWSASPHCIQIYYTESFMHVGFHSVLFLITLRLLLPISEVHICLISGELLTDLGCPVLSCTLYLITPFLFSSVLHSLLPLSRSVLSHRSWISLYCIRSRTYMTSKQSYPFENWELPKDKR